MPTLTLSIPEELHTIVKDHKEINWSEIARRAIWAEARKLALLNRLAAKSKLSERDINELDHLIKRGISTKYAD